MSSESDFSVGAYAMVLFALVVLTFGTVALSFVAPLSGWHMEFGLAIAAVKAALVVLFFMHALRTVHLNWVFIAAAMLWLFVLVSLTVADYTSRGLIPHMPGH